MKMEKIAFFVITFEQIKIQTYSAPQNDRLNFSFVENVLVVFEKTARNGPKTDIEASSKFWASGSMTTCVLEMMYINAFFYL